MSDFAKKLRESTPHAAAGLAPLEVSANRVHLVNGCDLTPKATAWLWPAWLALGKLHILAGAPGTGKTTIALGVAATVTLGGRWPDGERCEAGNVLVWSGEDDPADTLLPRLIAAGGDPSRVYFIEGARVAGEAVPFDPAAHMGMLLAEVQRIGGVRLLIVDPVVSAVAGDSHKNTEVRRALQPLVDLAASAGCAVLGISHFSKGGAGGDPAARVVGSVAFTAVARVVLVAAKTKDDEGRDCRILARAKSNIGPDDGGFEYHLTRIEALPGIEASRVEWGKEVQGSAGELLARADPDTTDAAAASNDLNDAAELLRQELTGAGWVASAETYKVLKDAGFAKKAVWAAGKRLNLQRKKGGMAAGWYWRLPGPEGGPSAAAGDLLAPEDSAEGSEGSNIPNGESSESSGGLESSTDDSEEVL